MAEDPARQAEEVKKRVDEHRKKVLAENARQVNAVRKWQEDARKTLGVKSLKAVSGLIRDIDDNLHAQDELLDKLLIDGTL